MAEKMKDLIAKLLNFTTSELCDGAAGGRVLDYQIKPMACYQKIAGPALTVETPIGEGNIVAEAITFLQEGQILVVAGQGHCQTSYWGDHRSFCAKFQKAAGIVIDGAFRDIEACETIGFPIYAKGLTCGSAKKEGGGRINVPVNCAGVTVHPGDIIVADRNGVIVLKPEELEQVIKQAEDKISRQQATVQKMLETQTVIPQIIKH